jgi:hypothetical protein
MPSMKKTQGMNWIPQAILKEAVGVVLMKEQPYPTKYMMNIPFDSPLLNDNNRTSGIFLCNLGPSTRGLEKR